MNKLAGKNAFITGANSGIGLATAQLFLSEGAQVVISGRRKEALGEALHTLGHGAQGLLSDAGKLSDIHALPGQLGPLMPHIDVLFVNAGVALFAPFDQTSEELFDSNMDINFKGVFFTIQHLLPMLKDGSSIILNASIVAHIGLEGSAAYSASKAAVLSLGKTLAIELAPRKIRVNTISPGPINTPIYGKAGMPAEVLQQFAAGVQAKIPLQQFGEAHDIAKAALFLASDDSSFITGSELTVDGGKGIIF